MKNIKIVDIVFTALLVIYVVVLHFKHEKTEQRFQNLESKVDSLNYVIDSMYYSSFTALELSTEYSEYPTAIE